jgi:hypothetical protein
MSFSEAVARAHALYTRYAERCSHEQLVNERLGLVLRPMDINGAHVPGKLPARLEASASTVAAVDGMLRGTLQLVNEATRRLAPLSIKTDAEMLTRGMRLFYINDAHVMSEDRRRCYSKWVYNAEVGSAVAVWCVYRPVVQRCDMCQTQLVGEWVDVVPGGPAAEEPQAVNARRVLCPGCAQSPGAAAGLGLEPVALDAASDPMLRVGSLFDYVPLVHEDGMPMGFWWVNCNPESPDYETVALMIMDHDDGKCALWTRVYGSVNELVQELTAYGEAVIEFRSDFTPGGVDARVPILSFLELTAYTRGFALFYPSAGTPVVPTTQAYVSLTWPFRPGASVVDARATLDAIDPFHRELQKWQSSVHAQGMSYVTMLRGAERQFERTAMPESKSEEEDFNVLRDLQQSGVPSSTVSLLKEEAVAEQFDQDARRAAVLQSNEPVKLDGQEVRLEDADACLYQDVLRVLPRMMDAFDRLAQEHPAWSEPVLQERLLGLDVDYARLAQRRTQLWLILCKRMRLVQAVVSDGRFSLAMAPGSANAASMLGHLVSGAGVAAGTRVQSVSGDRLVLDKPVSGRADGEPVTVTVRDARLFDMTMDLSARGARLHEIFERGTRGLDLQNVEDRAEYQDHRDTLDREMARETMHVYREYGFDALLQVNEMIVNDLRSQA